MHHSWLLRTRNLTRGRLPLLMGILNVTPDSFSDGGRFHALDLAVEQGLQLQHDGADILDIGGESTRPGATPVDLDEELRAPFPSYSVWLAKSASPSVSTPPSRKWPARLSLPGLKLSTTFPA